MRVRVIEIEFFFGDNIFIKKKVFSLKKQKMSNGRNSFANIWMAYADLLE